MMRPLSIGTHTFVWGSRTYVMGILNVTPDSFSGDGLLSAPPASPPAAKITNGQENTGRSGREAAGVEAALEQARRFVEAGADILDVGGESTRPGSAPVEVEEERRRVIPVIQALAQAMPDTPISVDTYKAVIAQEALEAGAQMVNDVWGLRADPKLREVVAKAQCPVILSLSSRLGALE